MLKDHPHEHQAMAAVGFGLVDEHQPALNGTRIDIMMLGRWSDQTAALTSVDVGLRKGGNTHEG